MATFEPISSVCNGVVFAIPHVVVEVGAAVLKAVVVLLNDIVRVVLEPTAATVSRPGVAPDDDTVPQDGALTVPPAVLLNFKNCPSSPPVIATNLSPS